MPFSLRSKTSQIIQYFLLLSIGLYLSWLFFRGLNFVELTQVISTGNFSWFYLVMLVSLMVYFIRVLRWQMLIKAAGHESNFLNAFSALSIGYFVSFVVPRLGEVTRCLSVKKYSRIPFMELLGTVIIERVVDLISLIIVLILTVILQFHQVIEFFRENIFQPICTAINGNSNLFFVILMVLGIGCVAFFYFRKTILERSPTLILQFIKGFKEGLISITKLRQKKLFILYTFLIWVCYYLMTYFWFFIFKETSVLGWGACLTILSIGTIGRSVPIQGGGMGAYHFLVEKVVILYGIGGLFGKTLATLIHAGQTFFTFAMGLVGLIIFFVNYWRNKKHFSYPIPWSSTSSDGPRTKSR